MNFIQQFLMLVVFLQVLVFHVLAKSIPSFVHLCKRNDPELNQCVINTFNEIRPYLVKGIPEMDLPPGEPLGSIYAATNTGRATAVSLEIHAENMTVFGLMGADIKNLTLDLDRPSCKLSSTFPYVEFQGIYKFEGRILVMEVNAMGPFKVIGTGIVADLDMIGKYYTKAGKEHLEFEKAGLKLQIGTGAAHFDDLIEGNEILTGTLNQAINDNIDDMIVELLPIIESVIGELTVEHFNLVLRAFAIDELFPRD